MSSRRLRTANYPPEARAALADAVVNARLAAGYKFRTDFARAHGIKSMRSLELLEAGDGGVGQSILFAVARALPGWTEDTPRRILEGAEPPVIVEQPAEIPRVDAAAVDGASVTEPPIGTDEWLQKYANYPEAFRAGLEVRTLQGALEVAARLAAEHAAGVAEQIAERELSDGHR